MRRHYFHRPEREVPMLNTSSLPDLIFTVLFFFMLVTHMRDANVKVRYQVPQGTELQTLNHRAATCYIYVGHAKGDTEGQYTIQLNDHLATIDNIRAFVAAQRQLVPPDEQAHMTVTLRADRDAPYGLIAEIKQALQRSFALKINYSATDE